MIWLRQPPGPPKPKHVLVHLERLKTVRGLDLPEGLEPAVHQNRLLKLAREGGQMTAQHLRDLEPDRRYATLVAVLLETRATLIDEIIDLHDRFMGALFSKAKRNHADRFQQSGKAINDKVRLYSRIGRALLDAQQSGSDPFAAIEAIIAWEVFSESITEAEKLAQPEDFDYLALIGDGFNQLRRYTPILLEALTLKAAPVARAAAGWRRGAEGHERAPGAQGAGRRAHRLRAQALGEPGAHARRAGPSLLRAVRVVGVEEFAALGRYLGAGLAPVQGFRGRTCCRPPRFAAQRDQPGAWPGRRDRLRALPGRPTGLLERRTGDRGTAGRGQRTCPTPPSPAPAASRSRRWTTPCRTRPKR